MKDSIGYWFKKNLKQINVSTLTVTVKRYYIKSLNSTKRVTVALIRFDLNVCFDCFAIIVTFDFTDYICK